MPTHNNIKYAHVAPQPRDHSSNKRGHFQYAVRSTQYAVRSTGFRQLLQAYRFIVVSLSMLLQLGVDQVAMSLAGPVRGCEKKGGNVKCDPQCVGDWCYMACIYLRIGPHSVGMGYPPAAVPLNAKLYGSTEENAARPTQAAWIFCHTGVTVRHGCGTASSPVAPRGRRR